MSNSTFTARVDRREEQLIKDAVRRRPLFSAFSVLVGTGAVALATMPAQAKAKSALDDMAWLPQSARAIQDNARVAPDVKIASLEAGAVAVVPLQDAYPEAAITGAPRADTASAPAVRVATRPPAVSHVAASEAAPQIQVEVPRRTRGFAEAGLVSMEQQAPVVRLAHEQPMAQPVAEAVPQFAMPARSEPAPSLRAPAATQAPAPSLLGLPNSPARPAASIRPARNMQADLIAVRQAVATGAVNRFDGDSPASSGGQADGPIGYAPPSARPVDADVSAVVVKRADTSTRKGRSNARGVDDGYADWLDDTAGSKALADRTVVPEQTVRNALSSAADIAAERSAAVRQARNDWEAAKFDVDQVKGQRWPQVQVGGNSPALRGSNNSFDDSNRPTANISVTTMVYDWGKTSKNIDSRTKTAQAAEFYYQTVAQQNAYEVSSNLVELTKNRAVYVIGESYVKRMQALVQMLAEIVKIDAGRLSELSQAKARLLQAQTSQEVVAAQVRSLELTVGKLTGDEPTPMPLGTRWQLRLDGLDDSVAAVAQNPAIEQAMAEAAAASATAKSVRAASLPQLNWVINKTTAHDSYGSRQPWTTMLQLSWTPFQGGSQQAAERAALAACLVEQRQARAAAARLGIPGARRPP